MFKVTNKMKDVRKFRDSWLGKDVLVKPKKSVLTRKPPLEGEVWKVEEVIEKKSEEKESKSKEESDVV